MKRYSAKGFGPDGITQENADALHEEMRALSISLGTTTYEYASATGRDLKCHPHLAEWAEIVMIAAIRIAASAANCPTNDAEAEDNLRRAHLILDNFFQQLREGIKAGNSTKPVISKHSVN